VGQNSMKSTASSSSFLKIYFLNQVTKRFQFFKFNNNNNNNNIIIIIIIIIIILFLIYI
jgi:hypothetical protein